MQVLDLFPLLQKLPAFMVLNYHHAKKFHQTKKELYAGPWKDAKRATKDGIGRVSFLDPFQTASASLILKNWEQPCFCVHLVKAHQVEKFSDGLAGYISGSLLEAGSDTTVATLIAFVQAILCSWRYKRRHKL